MPTNTEQARTASVLNVVAGLWLIVSPYVLGFSGSSAATNAIWVGIAVAALAIIRASSPASYAWISWINIILGVWLIVSSFIFGYAMSIIWNSIILGIIVIALSSWSSSSTARLGTGTT